MNPLLEVLEIPPPSPTASPSANELPVGPKVSVVPYQAR